MATVRAPREHGIGRGSNIDGRWSRVLIAGDSTKVVYGNTIATMWADLWLTIHRLIGFGFLLLFVLVLFGILLSMIFGIPVSRWMMLFD